MTQIIGMAKRLQEAEATIAELRRALEEKNDVKFAATSPADQDADPAAASQPVAAPYPSPSEAKHGIDFLRRDHGKCATKEELLSSLSLDDSGMVRIGCLPRQNPGAF